MNQIGAFKAAADALDDAGVVWWLSDGTALGAVREGQFLPSDRDVDLGFWQDDLPTVRAAFDRFHRAASRDLKYLIDGVKVDLHPHVTDGDTVWFTLGLEGPRYRYRFPSFDLEPVTFEGRTVQVPSPPGRYLTAHYGPDWRTPQSGWRWDSSPPCIELAPPADVSVSIAVMAHPARREWAEQLAGRLGCEIVWDRKQNVWDTARRAWLAHDPDATHHLVVQDDAKVCADLPQAAVKVARTVGDRPVSFTTIGYRLRHHVGSYQTAVKEGRTFWLSDRGISTVALMIPTRLVARMIAACDGGSSKHDDVRIMSWLSSRNLKTAYTIPALVDHRDRDENPTLVAGNGRGNHSRAGLNFIGEDGSGVDVKWNLPGRRRRVRKESTIMAEATFVRKGDPSQQVTVEVGSASYRRLSEKLSWAWTQIGVPDPAEDDDAAGPVHLGGGWYDVNGQRVRGKAAAQALAGTGAA